MRSGYATRLGTFLPTQDDLDEFEIRPSAGRLLGAFDRLVIWFNLLYRLHRDDDVSVLLASAHSKVIEIWILVPLGLLHSSYTALRTLVDICTSYTFYRSHPIEWRAVCNSRASWEGRGRIVEWHVNFSPTFKEVNKSFGLIDALTKDYRRLSDYVHAIPVTGLPTLKGIERTNVTEDNLEAFIEAAESVDANLNLLLLSVAYSEATSLSQDEYRTITKGINRSKLAKAGIVLPRT